MIRSLFISPLLIFFISCSSTKPTPYQVMKKSEGEGYEEKKLEDLRVISFKANSKTKKAKARLYAEFRAIEACFEEDKKMADMIDIFDKAIAKNITKTSGNVYGPSYYYGMYPYYSRYSSIGFSAGFQNIQSDSWVEAYEYPNAEVVFQCAETVWRPQLLFREIPPEEMKHLVKDLKGGIQIEKVLEKSPNADRLIYGDIILKANGQRIQRVFELIRLFSTKVKQVKVNLLREGEKKEIIMKASDVSDTVKEAQKKVIQEACSDDVIKKHIVCSTDY